jgi:hypothetical protein
MGIRAYRINKVEYKKQPTFNCGLESKLYDYLTSNASYENEGQFEVEISVLENALIVIPNLTDEVKKEINNDIQWARETGTDFVSYSTY